MRLLDSKQAIGPLAPVGDTAPPIVTAERVLMGALHMSPNLGTRMSIVYLGQCSVCIRDLLSQELKPDLTSKTPEEAQRGAAGLACIVGAAHSRQTHPTERALWARHLRDLMSIREAAYLDHCRLYGAGQQRTSD